MASYARKFIMLYHQWRQVAQARKNDFALREVASGRCWTFGELLEGGENHVGAPGAIAYPQGHSAEFILQMLAAWKRGQIVCPLEPGQTPPDVPLPPRACIHLKTTSATTGTPRLIAFTAPQLIADVENIRATMGLRAEWPNLAAISMAHSYGFSNLVLPLLLEGIPLIIAASPLPEAIRRAAEGEAALTLPGVPALWRAWHEARAIPKNVKLGISAGAPLPLSLECEIYQAHGLKVHNFLGASECGGIAYDRTEEPRTDAGCVGTVMQGVQVSINEAGCLQVHGAAVGETCWPEADPCLAGGYFQSSDLAEIKGAEIFLRGRVSDMINVAGRKVAPELIERALAKHPSVRECLVLGVPGSDHKESIAAVVACDSEAKR